MISGNEALPSPLNPAFVYTGSPGAVPANQLNNFGVHALLLAQALALLGRSHLSSNLNQIAHAVNIGILPVTPETEAELLAAVSAVTEMRGLFLRALGHQAEASR